MVDKLIITPDQLRSDSVELAMKVYDSGYRPTIMATLLWGGATVGHYIYKTLKYLGVEIRANVPVDADVAYNNQEELDGMEGIVSVNLGSGFGDLVSILNKDDRLLMVDEVCQTGSTIHAVGRAIEDEFGENGPQIRTAVIHTKPGENRTNTYPDHFISKTDDWIIYPWSLSRENTPPDKIEKYFGAEVARLILR